MIDLGTLKITIDTGKDKAVSELNDIGETADKQQSKFSKFGEGLKKGAVIGATAVAGLATGMAAMATKTAESTDRIDKMSNKIGISKQAFQEWDYVMGQNGMSIETMQVGMKSLVAQMDSAGSGTASAQEAFGALGVTWEDGTGKLKDQETMMKEAIMALANMENGTEKSRLATELFGKAGTEMLPMLNGGSEGIKELTERSHELGLVMSDETVTAGVALGDTMDDVKSSIGMVATKLGAEFMPIFQNLLDWVLAHMPEIQATIKKVTDFIQNIIIFLVKFWQENGEAISAITSTIFEVIKIVIETAMNVIQGIIKTVMALISGDWKGVWDGIKTIFTGIWNGMAKILPGLIDILVKIIKGFVKTFLNAGKDLFNAVWDGMKEVWNNLTKWVTEKISWLSDKLAFWRKGENEMSNGKSSSRANIDGSHANGLSYVPYDGYIAELHKGERVLTAQDNSNIGVEIADAANAIISALNNSKANIDGFVGVIEAVQKLDKTFKEKNFDVNLDGEKIGNSAVKHINSMTKMYGENPLYI